LQWDIYTHWKRDFYLTSVSQIIDDYAPDILILNRGAHYKPDIELIHHLNHSVVNSISNWQESCKQNGRRCHFVWRTTVPGHLNCSKYSKPSNSIEEMEKLVSTSSPYNWDKFKDQNKLVLDLLENTASIAYELMDAYFINILRPDAHPSGKDCLHSCLPKESIYSFITLHLLRIWNETKSR